MGPDAADNGAEHADRRRAPARHAAGRGRRSRLLRARRELSRRARCALRPAGPLQDDRLPARGRCGQHGRGLRQAHRPARRLLRHARSRRIARGDRRPYGAAGFDADDPVRRPGGAQPSRPRRFPGGRLPADVREVREVGDPDRGPAAHPRAGRPGVPHRRQRPAGPGRRGAARGHPEGDDAAPRRRRPSSASSRHRALAALEPDPRHAGDSGAAAAGAGRRRLECRGGRPDAALCRGLRTAGRGRVPLPGPF